MAKKHTQKQIGKLESQNDKKKHIIFTPDQTLGQTSITQTLNQAVLFHKQHQLDEAATIYRSVLERDQNHFHALHLLGNIYAEWGKYGEAVTLYTQALRQNPEAANVYYNLGLALYELKQYEEAIAHFRRALAINPDYIPAHINLGVALNELKRYEEAGNSLRRALEIAPGSAQAHTNLGIALNGLKQYPEAIANFRRSLEIHPNVAQTHTNLGIALNGLKQYQEAIASFRRSLEINPNAALTHTNLGIALDALREILPEQSLNEAAVESFSKAHELDSSNISTIALLASALEKSGRTDEGIALLQNMLLKYPASAHLMNTLGQSLQVNGQIQAAEEIFRKALSLGQGNSASCFGLSNVRKFTAGDDDIIHRMAFLLQNHNLPEADVRNISYALGKIYDDREEYDKAFLHYQRANATREKKRGYGRRVHEQFVDDSIVVFTRDFFADFAHLGTDQQRPVFIVGMPRSGTTLTEQIITSHPQVTGAGELEYFTSICSNLQNLLGVKEIYPLCCRDLTVTRATEIVQHYLGLLERHSRTARFVTDKMPFNYQYLGLIRLLFPKAPVIHCRRDPLDVCLSIFFQNFNRHPFLAPDLMGIGNHYLQYAKLMAHWRKTLPGPFMEIRYEDLIADQEQRIRELIAFCGLDWDEACIAFYQQKRDVRTFSNWQVRQPIYDKSVQRWKNYEKHLTPLADLFAEAKDEL